MKNSFKPAVSAATEAISKVALINGQVDFAVVDIGLPDRKGDLLVGELRVIYPHLPIIIASVSRSRRIWMNSFRSIAQKGHWRTFTRRSPHPEAGVR